MNFSISEEQKIIIEGMKSFGEISLNQVHFDKSIWQKAGEQGILGAGLSVENGGNDESFLDLVLMLEALGESKNSGMIFSMCAQTAACSLPIQKHGSDDQKKLLLPLLASGGKIAAHAMTESNSGSNTYKMATTAEKTAGGYILNGQKVFVSNAPVADVFVCFALTNKEKGYFGGISCFLIDWNLDGLKVSQESEKMGLPGSHMGTLDLTNVKVSNENLLGQEGAGSKIFSDSILLERVAMSAFHLGATNRILGKTIDYAKGRMVGGESIKQYQAVTHKLANIKMSHESQRWMLYKLAADIDRKSAKPQDAAIVKTLTSESWANAAIEALQIHGATGYMKSSEAQQWVKDALGSKLYSGSSEVQLNLVARTLGL